MTNSPKNIRPNLLGDYPEIHSSALIDPSAQIIGKVIIGENVFIAPLAVIRADEPGQDGVVVPISIGEEVNIQDGVIIHSHGGAMVMIGARTTVAHGVAIHGPCVIGQECFLAMRSTIYSATLESNVWVGMAALVMCTKIESHIYIPAGSIIRSAADTLDLRLVSSKENAYMQAVCDATCRLREDYFRKRDLGHSI